MNTRFGIAFLSAMFAVGTLAYAQESQPANQDSTTVPSMHHQHGKRGGGDPAKQVQHLTKELNLNSDQQSKVKSILEDQQKQMQSLRADTSMQQADKRSKFMDLRQSSSSQIRALLNADQQKKFDAMKQKREQKMAAHRAKYGSQSSTDSQPKQ
jgi:periplasmic protein CpxP/Spy